MYTPSAPNASGYFCFFFSNNQERELNHVRPSDEEIQEIHNQLSHLQTIESKLSDRDKFILDQIITGKLNKVIARELDLSERTIEKIRARIIKCFEVETIAQVIAKSVELSVIRKFILTNKNVSKNSAALTVAEATLAS